MKNVLILEKQTEALGKVSESLNPDKKHLYGGVFTEFGVLNRNQRIYTAEKFIPALDGLISEMKELGAIYGELDHPENFDSSFQRTSHAIKTVGYVPEKNRVEGSIHLLDTYWGKEAKAIVNDGYPIFVSSRAAGVTNEGGNVEIKKLFTYDIVSSPGFSSAKMSSINESCGFNNDTNFRIYEISDESKINELFNMNQNDNVTKNQLSEYSAYMISEIDKTKKKINQMVKGRNVEPAKMDKVLEYYEALNTDYTNIQTYLNYLTNTVNVLIKEKKSTNTKIDKLIKYNNYLAENLEKSINYSGYLAEQLDNSIVYGEYIAENLGNAIKYGEYIAENVDNAIKYGEYIAENLDNAIKYGEYIAENLDNNISYGNYIAEQLENTVQYSKNIATLVNENTKVFENTSIIGKLIPMPEDFGFDAIQDDTNLDDIDDDTMVEPDVDGYDNVHPHEGDIKVAMTDDTIIPAVDEPTDVVSDVNVEDTIEPTVQPVDDTMLSPTDVNSIDMPTVDVNVTAPLVDGQEPITVDQNVPVDSNIENVTTDVVADDAVVDGDNTELTVNTTVDADEEEKTEPSYFQHSYESKVNDITSKVDALLEKVKTQTVLKNTDYNFLRFLNKSQVDAFQALPTEDKEKVVLKLEENINNYYTSRDVLQLMNEALAKPAETAEERLIRLIPTSVKDIFESLNDEAKKYYILQAKLHPNLSTDLLVEHFWVSRDWTVFTKVNEGKTLLSEEKINFNDTLSDEAVANILNRMKNL